MYLVAHEVAIYTYNIVKRADHELVHAWAVTELAARLAVISSHLKNAFTLSLSVSWSSAPET